MDELSTYSCVSYFIKWDKCIHKKDSKKCKDIFDEWVKCHKHNRELNKTLEYVYSEKSMDGPYGGFS